MDHMATAKQIVEYFDGTLTFQSLIEPLNQARPLFPRLTVIANAALTNWDIRSEYVYIYLTVYGTLAALLLTLWRISKEWPRLITLTAALCISIVSVILSDICSGFNFREHMLFQAWPTSPFAGMSRSSIA
jgi:glucan phosphoethanolaminetransferase (alkaline phosphatase superfamily)